MGDKLLLSSATVARLLDFGEGRDGIKRVLKAASRGQLGPIKKIGRRVRFYPEHIYKLAGVKIPDGNGSPSR